MKTKLQEKNKKDFWNTGDAEYHELANIWTSEKFGNDWHEKYHVWWIEKLYDKFIENKI